MTTRILDANATPEAGSKDTSTRTFEDMYVITGNPPAMPDLTTGMVPHGTVLTRGVARNKGRGGRRRVANSLPMLPAEPTIRHTFRFARTGSGTQPIDIGDFASLMASAATSSTLRATFRTFRILDVVVRGSVSAVGETATVSLRYSGTNTNEQKYMDSTNKVDSNAMVQRKPPRFSLASFWHDIRDANFNDEMFTVQYFGAGECYLDITIQAVLDMNGDVNFTYASGTINQPGRLYCGKIGNGAFEPVGVVTTV